MKLKELSIVWFFKRLQLHKWFNIQGVLSCEKWEMTLEEKVVVFRPIAWLKTIIQAILATVVHLQTA